MKFQVNENIIKMKPYNPPLEGRAGSDYLLLDFNERTEPYDKKLNLYLNKFLKKNTLNLYPEYKNTCDNIARYVGVKKENVLITNGSDQAIDIIFKTFTKPNSEVIIPSPSFAWFFQCAKINDNTIISPLYDKKNLNFPIKDVLNKISKKTKLIVICNPNNPTGTLVKINDIETILKKVKKSIVYVDEAYFEFSGLTAVSLIKKYPNLVISRTFSKAFGLASLRIGYIISNNQIIKQMLKVRGPYDINAMSVCALEYVLGNINGLKKYVNEVIFKSKPLLEKYLNNKNILYYPSQANFLLIKPKNVQVLFNNLKNNKILTRTRAGRPINGTIRITVGTLKQTKKLISLLEKIM